MLASARAGERAEEGGVLLVGERREVGGRGKLPVGTGCQRFSERGAGGASTQAVRAVCAFTGRSVRSRPAERLRGWPFEETGRAGPRFGSRGGRPGRLAASGRAGQKQAGLGWVVRLGGLGPARVRGLLVFVFYLNGPFK